MPHDKGMVNFKGTQEEYKAATMAEMKQPMPMVVGIAEKQSSPPGFKRRPMVKW